MNAQMDQYVLSTDLEKRSSSAHSTCSLEFVWGTGTPPNWPPSPLSFFPLTRLKPFTQCPLTSPAL